MRCVGWKDWHLLNVVANLTVNHRLALRHGTITADRARQMADAFRAEALRAEEPGYLRIPSAQITPDAMEQGIRLVAVSSLHRWGLILHHGTTDSDAVMQLPGERYGFWDDDEVCRRRRYTGLLPPVPGNPGENRARSSGR